MRKRKVIALFLCFVFVIVIMLSAAGCSSANKDKDTNNNTQTSPTPTEAAPTKTSPTPEETVSTFGRLQLNEEANANTIDVPFKETKITPQVKAYSVNKDLSNIKNLSQYGSFTDEQKKLISQNGFVVCPTNEEQLFYIYENNEYKKIPSFITTDSVLQVYHIFYDYSLRTLENNVFLSKLELMSSNMLDKSIEIYNKLSNEYIKELQLKNIAYFIVANKLLEKPLPENMPTEAVTLANAEYNLINDEGGFKPSSIFPFDMDYSQFRPRGHYTRNDDLKRYFKAMMWYGQAPFPLYYEGSDFPERERNVDQTIQALLITYTLFIEKGDVLDYDSWENIYDTTVFYVGKTDDLNAHHYKELLIKVYGTEPDLNKLDSVDKLDLLYKEADKLPEPAIKAKYTSVRVPVGKQFRFMGQRYIPDSEVIQELVEPITRPVPSGLDVMAALGSERAADLQLNIYKVNDRMSSYKSTLSIFQEKFNKLALDKWQSNMYYGWLWVLRGLMEPTKEGYPSFMQTKAWEDKTLSTSLGSWAELRHDTILYGKQSGAECGGGDEPPQIKGYVEPNIKTYERLLWLTQYSRTNLKARDMMDASIENRMQTFEDLLQFLLNCSVKELRNEELTQEEYYQLLVYGGMLEYLTSSLAEDGMRWFEITSDTDKNMAVIADVHTIAPNSNGKGGYFEVGVGPAYEIYVVVPIKGQLYLTRGAVFSYYEFDYAEGKRLTDEEWQQMLKDNKQPAQPDWMDSYINGVKEEVPMPANPYSTGC